MKVKRFKYSIIYVVLSTLIIGITILSVLGSLRTNKNKNQPSMTSKTTSNSYVYSSDGTRKLTLTTTTSDDIGPISYSLKTNTTDSNNELIVFEGTVSGQAKISLPNNSWSNDNDKFFIIVALPEQVDYLVFNANGPSFKDKTQYINISEYWVKAKMKNKISTITGWADKDLLIIYTKNDDNSDGPHYWFVVSSKKFIQLSQ